MECIICRADEKKIPLVGVFCINCYKIAIKEPKPLKIIKCGKCGKLKITEWQYLSSEKLAEYLLSRIKSEYEIEGGEIDFKQKLANLDFKIEGHLTKRTIPYKIDILKGICDSCSRKSAGYFEAIIQLRGNAKKIEKEAKQLAKMIKSKDEFITKEEKAKEGLDLYVSSSKAVLEIMKELGHSTILTRTLHGVKQGKRTYRLTVALRI